MLAQSPVVIRTFLRDDATFKQVIQRVEENITEATKHRISYANLLDVCFPHPLSFSPIHTVLSLLLGCVEKGLGRFSMHDDLCSTPGEYQIVIESSLKLISSL